MMICATKLTVSPFAISILAFLPIAAPVLIISANNSVSGLKGQQRLVSTAIFKFFGPPAQSVLGVVTGVAVYPKSNHDLCHPSAEKVRNKIVFWDYDTPARCSLEDIYMRHDAAGAAALVKPTWSRTPGAGCFIHGFNWRQTQKARMTLVEVYKGDLVKLMKKCNPHLEFQISPPHDESYYRSFTSWYWTVLIRVCIPLVGFWTSMCALVEWYRGKQSFLRLKRQMHPLRAEVRRVGFTVFVIEGISIFVLSIMAALGHLGPLTLPSIFFTPFLTGLSGSSVICSTLLAVVMREQRLALSASRLPMRSFWAKYKMTMRTIGILFWGLDILPFCLSISDNWYNIPALLLAMYTLLFAAKFLVACFFVTNSYKLHVPLRGGHPAFRMSQGARDPLVAQQIRQLRRVAFTIVMVGGTMLISTGLLVCTIYFVSAGVLGSHIMVILVLGLLLARITTAYWHVQAMKPSSFGSTNLFLLKFIFWHLYSLKVLISDCLYCWKLVIHPDSDYRNNSYESHDHSSLNASISSISSEMQ